MISPLFNTDWLPWLLSGDFPTIYSTWKVKGLSHIYFFTALKPFLQKRPDEVGMVEAGVRGERERKVRTPPANSDQVPLSHHRDRETESQHGLLGSRPGLAGKSLPSLGASVDF